MAPEDWFLTPAERGNPDTVLDRGGPGYSTGNLVRPLVHGRTYFAELCAAIGRQRAGDLLLFTDWRGDPDERLAGHPDSAVEQVIGAAAARGVVVKGLVWRSHLDGLRFSERENRYLGEDIEAAGGECLLDTRVRAGGSHHQKFVVLRHPGRPELDVAFVGGIDLCHGRNDDETHVGDPQPVPMAPEYGNRPPWHDVQVEIRGPAVDAVETVFRERWTDPHRLTRNPVHRVRDLLSREDTRPGPLPPRLPPPGPAGTSAVQLLRTYPYRRPGYPFARRGERSIARGYAKALGRARHVVYLEEQYLWSAEVTEVFAKALRDRPELRLVAIVPQYPDQPGAFDAVPQELGRAEALATLLAAGGDRVGVYCPYSLAGVPVYVHAKVCVIDDTWATIGSDNVNRRSWTHDSELSCAVVDERVAGELRRTVCAEHVGTAGKDPALDLARVADTIARSAAALDAWYASGRTTPRPPGRLRRYRPPDLPRRTRLWAAPLNRWLCDPDGRPPELRRAPGFAC